MAPRFALDLSWGFPNRFRIVPGDLGTASTEYNSSVLFALLFDSSF